MTREILAPLDGKVLQLKIIPGDAVEEDEEILVIEAMKTETPVFAPCDGFVKEVRVKEGDDVTENDVLTVIDNKYSKA
jgi:acetyl-CoA carboxylase biotin carboxyl carrier protein